ncbi:MAG TPA: SDR family oxidoreductase [Gaiella sp.]|jgi:NAD(P)-dependent dehydrogenase (short-subunit alcohol dehydrogenase family)
MATWVVTGANRGIGLELCRQVRARGDAVVAACRTASPELAAVGCRVVEGVDVASDDGVARLDGALGDDAVDVLVCNAGQLRHERIDSLDLDGARQQYEVNALGALRVVSALLPRLGQGAKIGLVSSKAGSMGDGPSGGMYGYRMSKAALNMAAANMAHELAPRGILVVALHPGFVRTEMTGGGGNTDPDEAAAGLIARIDELDAGSSGRFVHANGDEIPW